MAVSRLLLFAKTAPHPTFFGSVFGHKFDENYKYLSKSDETWTEFYRVGRSGDSGRHPRARFGPERAKNIKIYKKI